MKTTNGAKTEKKAPVKTITSLAEMLEIIGTPVRVKFLLDGQPCELEVRRAMPSVIEKRREILRVVTPPFDPKRNDYDTLNPAFLAQRDASVHKSRSVVIYQCCPQVAALKPGLLSPEEIWKFIAATLPETIQELIELTALAGGLDTEVAQRSNFT